MEENSSFESAELEVNSQNADLERARQERRGQLVSMITTVAVHAIILLLLTLIFVSLGPEEVPQIVAVTEKGLEQDNLNKKDFARSVQQKPQPAQSASRVQPIAAAMASPIAVPTIEDPVEVPVGIGVDIGRGFGFGRGKGGGGGGGSMSFFGAKAKANKVVFLVDFSGSMIREGGGVRLERLKTELVNSLSKLPKGMEFQVIYYSHAPWLGGETLLSAPARFADNPADRIPWSQATKEGIAKAINDVRMAQTQGGTRWKPPLELALAMRPAPSLIWLLSDGAADDREEVLEDMQKINPLNVPINTIGLELPGPGFTSLVGISRRTGGQASIVIKGRLYTGAAALRYATDEFGGGADFQ